MNEDLLRPQGRYFEELTPGTVIMRRTLTQACVRGVAGGELVWGFRHCPSLVRRAPEAGAAGTG